MNFFQTEVLVVYRYRLHAFILPRLIFAVAYFITTIAVLMILRLTNFLEAQTVIALQALASGFFVNAIASRVVREIRVLVSAFLYIYFDDDDQFLNRIRIYMNSIQK